MLRNTGESGEGGGCCVTQVRAGGLRTTGESGVSRLVSVLLSSASLSLSLLLSLTKHTCRLTALCCLRATAAANQESSPPPFHPSRL